MPFIFTNSISTYLRIFFAGRKVVARSAAVMPRLMASDNGLEEGNLIPPLNRSRITYSSNS
jgi:hypothetical protein